MTAVHEPPAAELPAVPLAVSPASMAHVTAASSNTPPSPVAIRQRSYTPSPAPRVAAAVTPPASAEAPAATGGGRTRSYAFYHCPPPVFNARGEIVWAQRPALQPHLEAATGGTARTRRLPSKTSSQSIHPLHVNSLVHYPRFLPSARFAIGYAETIGLRPSMEDSVAIAGAIDCTVHTDFFAVFDGHNGSDASEYAAKNMHVVVLEKLRDMQKSRDVPTALRSAFKSVQKKIMASQITGGTTATCVLFRGDEGYVAHVGDSSAAILADGCLKRLTRDHRPTDADEARAVQARGGMVSSGAEPRVNGVLSLTRALGDRELAGVLSAEPAVARLASYSWTDSTLIIGCDGLWDHVTDEEVASVLRAIPSPEAAAMQLRDTAFMNGSTDNITVLVIKPDLPPQGNRFQNPSAAPCFSCSVSSPAQSSSSEQPKSEGAPASPGPPAPLETRRDDEAASSGGRDDEDEGGRGRQGGQAAKPFTRVPSAGHRSRSHGHRHRSSGLNQVETMPPASSPDDPASSSPGGTSGSQSPSPSPPPSPRRQQGARDEATGATSSRAAAAAGGAGSTDSPGCPFSFSRGPVATLAPGATAGTVLSPGNVVVLHGSRLPSACTGLSLETPAISVAPGGALVLARDPTPSDLSVLSRSGVTVVIRCPGGPDADPQAPGEHDCLKLRVRVVANRNDDRGAPGPACHGCLFAFSRPEVPVFDIEWGSEWPGGDRLLNWGNPIRHASGRPLFWGHGCSGDTLEYLADDGVTWLASYVDAGGWQRDAIHNFYVSGTGLFVRRFRRWQGNLPEVLRGRTARLRLTCDRGVSSCVVFRVAPAADEWDCLPDTCGHQLTALDSEQFVDPPVLESSALVNDRVIVKATLPQTVPARWNVTAVYGALP
eukprot:m51a1_g7428 putative protein phosphatase domain containing protein (885) ;mRNA; r:34385-38482